MTFYALGAVLRDINCMSVPKGTVFGSLPPAEALSGHRCGRKDAEWGQQNARTHAGHNEIPVERVVM